MNDQMVVQNADFEVEINLLENWIDREYRRRQIPGLSVGVVAGDSLVWSRGFGLANIDQKLPITKDTRYRIGSITKTFTATAIMQLMERGLLQLDDPLKKYLPWFDIQYTNAPPITIRHILMHTSGLPLDATVPHWTENQFQTWAEIVATSPGRQACFPPNAYFKYSNYGFALLGGVIETVSGQPYADYIQNQILAPLNMHETVVVPISDDKQMAAGYIGQPGVGRHRLAPFTNVQGYTPAFGIASTVADLAAFAIQHLSDVDTTIIKAITLCEMHRVQWLEPHWQAGHGFGFNITPYEGRTVSVAAGEVKGFTAQLALFRSEKLGVIVLTNSVFSNPNLFAHQIVKRFLPLVGAFHASAEARFDPAWSSYTGIYTTEWGGDTQVVLKGQQLQIIDLTDLDDVRNLQPTDDPQVFQIEAGYWVGETCRFELDDRGQVSRLWVGSDYAVPKTN